MRQVVVAHFAYIVHDLNDPAVSRRIEMLRAAGDTVTVLGFYRGELPPPAVAGCLAIPLGRTADGRLIQRAMSVARRLAWPEEVQREVARADVVIARNLECLALAASPARRSRKRLVYECLDIHRVLLSDRRLPRLLQRLEARLLKQVDLLLVSSPAYLDHYFSKRPELTAPRLLVENKLLELEDRTSNCVRIAPGPPWAIGWLGNLRCRRSFDVLTDLARRLDGKVEIVVAGRPSPAVFDDLPGALAQAPHCTFLGSYHFDELAGIYARCHFAWSIDWFEDGLNSLWLLPNRLYEAQAYGTVPIAFRSVQIGKWLATHQTGMLVDDALTELEPTLARMTAEEYTALQTAVARLSRRELVAGPEDCRILSAQLQGHVAPD